MKSNRILSKLSLGDDSIFSYPHTSTGQSEEIRLRESVAEQQYADYLLELSKYHSIPVMDREVRLFLNSISKNGSIMDVGGCWGWHWRNIQDIRPDAKIYIVDFVRSNLFHAKNVLGDCIGDNVFLVHGDATNLVFEDNSKRRRIPILPTETAST